MPLLPVAVPVWPLLGSLLLQGCPSAPKPDSGQPPASHGDSAPVDTSPPEVAVAPVADVAVQVHPEVATILRVSWTQLEDVEAAWLEFTFENDDWLSSPPTGRQVGEQSEVILGVPGDTEVTFRIMNQVDGQDLSSEQQWTGTTGSVPEALLEASLITWDPTLASPEPYILGSVDVGSSWYSGPFWVFIMDRQARYVWYHQIPGTLSSSLLSLFAQVSSDGTHILFDASTYYFSFDDWRSTVFRMTLDHGFYEEIEIPDLSFTFDEIDGGVILYDQDHENLVERQPDGSERVIWECAGWMRSLGHSSAYCAPNSVVYIPATDTVLWSMYNADTVVELERQSGEIVRYFGQLPGGWAFDPPDTVVDYQHYPSYTPDGTLIVSTHVLGQSQQQRAREYLLDDATQTLTDIWHYGEEVPFYANYGGEAFRLDNGNTLICYGTDGAMREVTADKKTAWSVEWPVNPNSHLTGHNSFIRDLYALNRGPDG